MSAAKRQKINIKKEPIVMPNKSDIAINEWARKLASRPTPLSALTSPIADPEINPLVIIPANSRIDEYSARGKFGWETLPEDKLVPCIYRNKKEFVAVRMAEISVLQQLLNVLPVELYESVKLVSHPMTITESRLLDFINMFHCDGFYGSQLFTPNDTVISLKDLETFYLFLLYAYNVLQSGGQNADTGFTKCGFVRVNSEAMIPYAVFDSDEKGVPLFYFEGQTDILKERVKSLTGWPLAFLKVCCKVQSVRQDLLSSSTLDVVTLTDLKAYFPRRTTFTEECWPPHKARSLIDKKAINLQMGSPVLRVTCDNWTKLVPNETAFSNFVPLASTYNSNLPRVVMKNANVPQVYKINTIQTPKSLQKMSPHLAKIKISREPRDKSKLICIPENPAGGIEGAFIVKLVLVQKELFHCVNFIAEKCDEDLVPLQQFINRFFYSVAIYPTVVNALNSCGVFTYLPNSSQMKALNDFGYKIQYNWEMPLISAHEIPKAMLELKERKFRRRPVPSTSAGPSSSLGAGATANSFTSLNLKN